MRLTNINMLTPKKVLLTTVLVASLAAGGTTINVQNKDSFEKTKVETVDKSFSNKFISAITAIDEYDTKVIDKVSGNKEDYFTKENKTLIRILTGLIMSVIGGMVGNLRAERGKKHIAKPETASNLGFAFGFILPGFTACATFAASIGVLLKPLVSSYIKK